MPSSIRSLFVASLLTVIMTGPGCQRDYYYHQADEEATALITEKSADPRWGVDDFDVQIDPRSRFANEADPVRPPMPPDDPSSNQLMQSLAGMEGYAGWGANGMADVRENPQWREQLREYMELDKDGRIRMDLEGAIRMSMIHSPAYQATIETLYLSALDVSTERFRFDVQFFGGNDTDFSHRGDQNFGGESNTLTNGNNFRVRRKLATAGQIVVDFANTFTWQFAGADSNAAASLLGFSIVQPLLRSGGRVVGLEQLTRAERTLLANMRAFQRYRKGFYTDLAIGSRGSTGGPRRSGGFFGGTGLTGFSGQGSGGFGGVGSASGFGGFFGGGATGGGGAGGGGAVAGVAGGGAGNVGGYIGLLQSLQQLRNAQDNLALQQRTLALLQALREAGQIGADQVLSFEQSIETGKANMLQSNNGYKSTVENFVMSSFGLPGTVEITLDDTIIRPFQFIDPRVTTVETSVSDLVATFGLIENPTDEQLNRTASHARKLHEDISGLTQLVVGDLDALTAKVPVREAHMADEQKQQFAADRAILTADLKRLKIQHEKTRVLLGSVIKRLTTKLDADGKVAVVADLIAVNASLAGTVGEMALVQAGSRLEAITLDQRVELSAGDALEIARSFRLDWMNARASLVDGWRLVEYNANALESDLSIVFSGDMKGDKDNPLKLEGARGTLRAGLQFDAPLTRLLERNNFRQQLINYEQSRRGMITYEDGLRQSFRLALRTLGQREKNLEIQRRAVKIAIRRVDQTRQMLTKPPAPGQPAVLSPTATQDLLSALAALRESQNNFMSVWLAYYSGRMSLMRDLGVMRLDENGIWIDEPLEDALDEARKHPTVLPPAVPEAWLQQVEAGLETVRLVPDESVGTTADEVDSESDDAADAEDSMVGVPEFLRPGKLTIKKPAFLDRLKQKWNDKVRPIRRASRTASDPEDDQPPLESLPVPEARPVPKAAGVGERESNGVFQPRQPRQPRPLRERETTQEIEVPPVSAPLVSGAVVPTESYQSPRRAASVKPAVKPSPTFLLPRIR